MLKLMKYEMRKTAFSKFVLLVLTAVAEVAFLLGLLLDKGELLGTAAVFLVLFSTVGIVYIGIQSALLLRRELNCKESYMLFMTPNSNYKILGAKILENLLSILVTGVFFLLLAGIDITIATVHVDGLEGVMNMLNGMLNVQFNVSVSKGMIVLNYIDMLMSWICVIVIADFAVVLSATIFNGKKGNGVVAFAIFCILAWLQGVWLGLIPDLPNYNITLLLDILTVSVIGGILYYVSGWIMEKKLSV